MAKPQAATQSATPAERDGLQRPKNRPVCSKVQIVDLPPCPPLLTASVPAWLQRDARHLDAHLGAPPVASLGVVPVRRAWIVDLSETPVMQMLRDKHSILKVGRET
jgi:hypothetical protein